MLYTVRLMHSIAECFSKTQYVLYPFAQHITMRMKQRTACTAPMNDPGRQHSPMLLKTVFWDDIRSVQAPDVCAVHFSPSHAATRIPELSPQLRSGCIEARLLAAQACTGGPRRSCGCRRCCPAHTARCRSCTRPCAAPATATRWISMIVPVNVRKVMVRAAIASS